MEHGQFIRPLLWWERLLTVLMIPLMDLAQGTIFESPQETHRWNNHKLTQNEIEGLDHTTVVDVSADPTARRRYWWKIPIFHIPILGGWRSYVVLRPKHHLVDDWYVGWIAKDVIGVSRIPLTGPVRVLRGDDDVAFFGVYADGTQVPIEQIGKGRIGDGGPWRHVHLR